MIEQFRAGTLGEQLGSHWLLEIVAGIMDGDDDDLEAMVRRETVEESGCDVIDLLPICDYWVSPGGATERVALFCGLVDASQAEGIHGLDDENENIRVFAVSSEQAFAAVREGSINNASTIIAVQWLQLQRDVLSSSQ